MENKTFSRKYFSYSEVLKNPVRPFLNNEKDTTGKFITNQELLDKVMTDVLSLFKNVDASK